VRSGRVSFVQHQVPGSRCYLEKTRWIGRAHGQKRRCSRNRFEPGDNTVENKWRGKPQYKGSELSTTGETRGIRKCNPAGTWMSSVTGYEKRFAEKTTSSDRKKGATLNCRSGLLFGAGRKSDRRDGKEARWRLKGPRARQAIRRDGYSRCGHLASGIWTQKTSAEFLARRKGGGPSTGLV